jgi:small subunit ribosomal protein S8
MVNDHLSDFVTRIRNGYMARKKMVEIPDVKVVVNVAEVLVKTGYLAGVKREEKKIFAQLKYQAKEPALTGIERVSRPGARIYSRVNEIKRVLGGLGINILSTPNGVMSDVQAKKVNSGGEILLKVW